MVDDRASGFYGIGGGIGFKGDNASTSFSREKNGQGGEYFAQEEYQEEEQPRESEYVDRSALIRATLNSIAMFNIANILKDQLPARGSANDTGLPGLADNDILR